MGLGLFKFCFYYFNPTWVWWVLQTAKLLVCGLMVNQKLNIIGFVFFIDTTARWFIENNRIFSWGVEEI